MNAKITKRFYSDNDLAWQSLHLAAAAACRGSTSSGGGGDWANKVMVRNRYNGRTCKRICLMNAPYVNCDAEVSIYGKPGKATFDGEIVGSFYNYGCQYGLKGGSEATGGDDDIQDGSDDYFGFCCCRK